MHQLFIDFKKAYDSVRREVLYNTLIDIGIPMKLERLIKMWLQETSSSFRVGIHLFGMFPTKNGLKQGDALSPLFFKLALQHAIRKVQVRQDTLKLNVTPQFLVYADHFNILAGNVHTIMKNTVALVAAVRRLDWKQMLIKLRTWSCLEIRMQDEVSVQRLIIVLSNVCNILNIWEQT